MFDRVMSKWFKICLLIVCIGFVVGVRLPSATRFVNQIYVFLNNSEMPLIKLFQGNVIEISAKIITLPIDTIIWLVKLLWSLKYVS